MSMQLVTQHAPGGADTLEITFAAKPQPAPGQLRVRVLAAPADGLVSDTYFVAGEMVGANAPVVSILPPGNVKLRFYVPEEDAAPEKDRTPSPAAPPPVPVRPGPGVTIPPPGALGAAGGPLAASVPPVRNATLIGDGPTVLKHVSMVGSDLALDEGIGKVLAALEESGQLKNTLVIFTSDQGFAWGQHGFRHKLAPYDANIRSPLVISMPGTIAEGKVCRSPVGGADLVARRQRERSHQ